MEILRKIIIVLIGAFSLATTYAQSVSTMLNQVNKGERRDTLVSFGKERTLTYVPLTVIKGNKSGGVYTIVAGVHGYEYPPIIAVQELMKEIDVHQLHGTLIILPIANIGSFYKRSPFINPDDNKNLNTVFPGSVSGSITERISHWITTEIIPASDIFLDIHGGDASEDLVPFICYYDNKDQQTERARLLSEASGMEYIVSYPYNITKTEAAKYAFKQAVQDGKVALSIEAGKLGTVQQENVRTIKEAVYNMLNHCGMYKNSATKAQITKKNLSKQSYIKVPVKGIFYSSIKSGDVIQKDQHLGYITDEFGNVRQQISAPVSGVVLYKIGTPPVNTEETLFCIGY